MNYQEKSKLYDKAKNIIASNLPWDEKYDFIFSKEISHNFSLDYYDPDTSYEEDVMAFMNALDQYMEENKINALKDMKEQIIKIAKDLEHGTITENEAQCLLLCSFDVMTMLPTDEEIIKHAEYSTDFWQRNNKPFDCEDFNV